MDRCKLEYMIKNCTFEQKKHIIREVDPYGNYMFGSLICQFLKDPDNVDEDVLFIVSVGGDEQILNEEKQRYIDQYKKINDLCIEYNMYPFFKDPTNIKESEATRQDIIKIIPEEMLNDFFGVNSIRDYEPPLYDDKK